MIENPKLSIGIVTYNGQFLLKEVLESIAVEIENKNVELLISDNASTDNTENIITQFKKDNPDTVYIRNSVNIGFDANVNQVVEKVRGKYVWLMSDDDFILEGGVDNVLKVINENDNLYSIFVNYENTSTRLLAKNDTLYNNGRDFFHDVGFKNGLISSNVVNKEVWMRMNMTQYIDCAWIHVAYALRALAPNEGGTAYIITKPFIKQDGIQRWGKPGAFIDINIKLIKLLESVEDLDYRITVEEVKYKIQKSYVRNIPWQKKSGMTFDIRKINELKIYYGKYLNFWVIDVPMLLTPCFVFRLMFDVFHKIRNG